MKNRKKFMVIGMIAIVALIVGLVAYNTEKKKAEERAAEAKRIEEEQKAREAQEAAEQAAEEYRAQASSYMEEGKYSEAQEAIGKAVEQTPENQELAAEAEELNQKAEEMKGHNATMEAAVAAIEADDAEALDQLQDSEEGKALEAMAEEEGSYIYFPEGEGGKGIGFYTFEDCDQWYYGDYVDGKREGDGIWYYTSSHTEDGSLYKEVYDGQWEGDAPNGKGRQLIVLGDHVDTNKRFKVKDGLFYGTYKIKDTLEDGTEVTGKYTLKKGKYVTISDEELEQNNFVVPDEPHLAIAFLYDGKGEVKSCTMIYAEDTTKGVKHFY